MKTICGFLGYFDMYKMKWVKNMRNFPVVYPNLIRFGFQLLNYKMV